MEIFNKQPNFDFVGQRKLAVRVSGVLLVLAIACIAVRGLAFGIDFTGGTLIEVGYSKPADIEAVRSALASKGFPEAIVQHFGTTQDVLVRIAPREGINKATLSAELEDILEGAEGTELDMRRVEFVGPQVGEELTEQGILAVIYALIGIFLYVMFRFQWRFSVGAVIALVHDITISLGVISLVQIQFDLTVVAALLAVIGYSLNDTIVLFDRIRENFPRMLKSAPNEVVNTSVNQTLSRTVMTSLTTLLVLIALFVFGGEIIHAFAFTLIVGVIIGTYSSIYVASTSLLRLGVSKFDLLQVEKEGAEFESNPLP